MWLDCNGVTLFVQQYDRCTRCRPLQRQQYELLLYKYLVPGTWVRLVTASHTKNEMLVLNLKKYPYYIMLLSSGISDDVQMGI